MNLPQALRMAAYWQNNWQVLYQYCNCSPTFPAHQCRSRQDNFFELTVFMTLLAAFKVLLYRYSGQTDLVVGSPIANSTYYQIEDLIVGIYDIKRLSRSIKRLL